MSEWVDSIVDTLRVVRDGILVRVSGAKLVALGTLVRGLFRAGYAPAVMASVEEVLALEPGVLAVLVALPAHATLLNMARPLFADRALRVVLWTDDKAGIELRQRAPDFLDWVSLTVPCPDVIPYFWIANIRAAMAAGMRGATWPGPGSPVPALEAIVGAGRVGVIEVLPEDFDELTDLLWKFDGFGAVVVLLRGVLEPMPVPLRWAIVRTGHENSPFIVLDRSGATRLYGTADAGYWTVDTILTLDEVVLERQGAGLTTAAVLDFEAAAIGDGTRAADIDPAALAQEEDPGASTWGPAVHGRIDVITAAWNLLPAKGWDARVRHAMSTAEWAGVVETWSNRVEGLVDAMRTYDRDPALTLLETGVDPLFQLAGTKSSQADREIRRLMARRGSSLEMPRWPPLKWARRFAATGVEMRLANTVSIPEWPEVAALARRAGYPRVAESMAASGRREGWFTSTAGFSADEWGDEVLSTAARLLEYGNLAEASRWIDVGAARWPDGLSADVRRELLVGDALLRVELGRWADARRLADRLRIDGATGGRLAALLEQYVANREGGRNVDDSPALAAARLPTQDDFGPPHASMLRILLQIEAFESQTTDLGKVPTDPLNLLERDVRPEGNWQFFVDTTRMSALVRLFENRDPSAVRNILLWQLDLLINSDPYRPPNPRHYLRLRAELYRARLDRAEGNYLRARRRLTKILRRYATTLPPTMPDHALARCERATLALVEYPPTIETLASAEHAVDDLATVFLSTHPDVQRHAAVIELARRQLIAPAVDAVAR